MSLVGNVQILKKTMSMFCRTMEQHALKNVYNCLNTNIDTYLETSGGQSFNP